MILCSRQKRWVFQFSLIGCVVTALLLLLVVHGVRAWAALRVLERVFHVGVPLLLIALFRPRFGFFMVRNKELLEWTLRGWRRRRMGGLKIVAIPGRGYRGQPIWHVAIEGPNQKPLEIDYEVHAAGCAALVSHVLGIPIRRDCMNTPEVSAAWLARQQSQ